LREVLFKYRGLVWGIFAAAVLVCDISFSLARLRAALPPLALGQGLRFWAAGFIPKYRTLVVDAPRLVTAGPYAWMRNPLYAGNGIMGFGWAFIAGWRWAAAFSLIYFALYSLTIIPFEEKFLRERFGEEYDTYRKSTPSLFPGFRNLKERAERSRKGFDAKKAWSMERHSLRVNILVTALVLARMYFSVKK
jgi:protein-S-isoprenylcysteine O-methyltransferase Ste14